MDERSLSQIHLFVPGRLCLFGEHSDWAGMYRTFNADIVKGTDPKMTRFLMNLDEAVELIAFAFEHAEPGDLFIQKADASTIGDLADGVMKVFGETEKKIIGSRHGEKLYETLMTREERLRSVDMGHYFRIAPDARGLNYDKFYVQGTVVTKDEEAYTSHNTHRLDVDGVVRKIMGTDYVKEELEGRPHTVEA